MALFDFTTIPDDPTKIQDGSGDRPTPGKGMALITGWEEYGGANGQAHKLSLEIVAWTNPQDVAKRHDENIFHKDNSGKGFPQKRMTCLAMAAGLFTANDVKKWKAAGTQPDIDMASLVGRAIMIELVEEPDKNDASKKYIKIGNIGLGFWHIKDPRCKGWPVNQAVINRVHGLVGDWVVEEKPVTSKPAASGNPFAGAV